MYGGVGSVRRDGSLEVGEAVGVEAAAHLEGVADDLELALGADVGGYVADLPVGHAEARHVLLRKRLPPRRGRRGRCLSRSRAASPRRP